jgi:hypothetical protein
MWAMSNKGSVGGMTSMWMPRTFKSAGSVGQPSHWGAIIGVVGNPHPSRPFKTYVSNWRWKWMVLTQKGTNLETKLLKVRHMLMPKFFYFGPLNYVFETNIFEHVWPPHEEPGNQRIK